MLTQEMVTDMQLIRARAEFIKQTLISSGKDEFDQHETVARGVSGLIDDVNLFADDYQLPVAMDIMLIKLIGTKTYKKEDLVYRVEQILAIADSILGKQKQSLNKKGGSKMRAIQRRDESLPVMQDVIQGYLRPKPEREFNLFSRRVTNTFIRMKVYNNCTFYLGKDNEEDD